MGHVEVSAFNEEQEGHCCFWYIGYNASGNVAMKIRSGDINQTGKSTEYKEGQRDTLEAEHLQSL